jgi:hypothetical protein
MKTCADFERWLDEGRPKDALMEDHAAACLVCARQLRTALELDGLLAVPAAAQLDGSFNDGVMRQIRLLERPRRSLAGALLSIIAEPIVPIALAVASIIAWQYGAVSVAATRAAQGIALTFTSDLSIALSGAIALAMAAISWIIFRRVVSAITP